MAITAPTTLSDFEGFIQPEMAEAIFDDARKTSAAMQIMRRQPMGPSGVAIPVTTVKPEASWVGEGLKKPATKGGMTLAMMEPKKIAALCVVSDEVFRANPGNYVTSLRASLAEAFATAFDAAVFLGVNTPFDHYIAETTKTVTLGTGATVYNDIVQGLRLLVADGYNINGFVFDTKAEPELLDATDDVGRPLLTPSTAEGVYGTIIRRNVYLTEGVGSNTIAGFGGDWSKCAWGVVGGIRYSVSTEATVTINGQLVSCFENNLVAILAEAEYGFVMPDTDAFVVYKYPSVS